MTEQFNPNIIPPMRSFTDFYIRVYAGILYNAVLYHYMWIDLLQVAELKFIPGVVSITEHESTEVSAAQLTVKLNGMDFHIYTDEADGSPLLSWESGMLSIIDSPIVIYNCLQGLDASGVPFLPADPEYYKVDYLSMLARRMEMSAINKVSHMALWIQRSISEFVPTYIDKELIRTGFEKGNLI